MNPSEAVADHFIVISRNAIHQCGHPKMSAIAVNPSSSRLVLTRARCCPVTEVSVCLKRAVPCTHGQSLEPRVYESADKLMCALLASTQGLGGADPEPYFLCKILGLTDIGH
jgi:hypothetical protein